MTRKQIAIAFDNLLGGKGSKTRHPIVVAAAGNKSAQVSLPASLNGIIAVGSFDLRTRSAAPYSRYRQVPEGRYILAAGGMPDELECVGTPRKVDWARRTLLYGTSFAVPIISAILARYIAEDRNGSVDELRPAVRGRVLERLSLTANRDFAEFSKAQSGLGLGRYEESQPSTNREVRCLVLGMCPHATPIREVAKLWTLHTGEIVKKAFWIMMNWQCVEHDNSLSSEEREQRRSSPGPAPKDLLVYQWPSCTPLNEQTRVGDLDGTAFIVMSDRFENTPRLLREHVEQAFPGIPQMISGFTRDGGL